MGKITTKDRKILFELAKNCRLTNSQLAKKVQLSREVVAYNIKKLENKGIITKYTVELNSNALGYQAFDFSFKLQNCTKTMEEEIISKLIKLKDIVFLEKVLGYSDFAGGIFVKSNEELERITDKIRQILSDNLARISLDVVVRNHDFFATFFAEKHKSELEINYFGGKQQNIDEIDKKILRELVKNSRKSIVEISNKLKITIPIVTYRLKKLVRDKIILSFRPVINFEKLGYSGYTLLLDFSDNLKERKLIEYAKRHNSIWNILKHIGNYNYIIEVLCKNNKEFKGIVEEIIHNFSESIIKHDIFIITKELKHSYYLV